MQRRKKANVEIVPASEAALVPKAPAAKLQDMLDRMVRERVDEILAQKGAALLEPDFESREIALAIRDRQTVFDRRKWTLYFEKWGCRGMCGRKKTSHAGNGYCNRCHVLIFFRLKALKREFEQANPDREKKRQIDQITSRVRSAQAFLGEGKK